MGEEVGGLRHFKLGENRDEMTPNMRSISQESECFKNSHAMDIIQQITLKTVRTVVHTAVLIGPLFGLFVLMHRLLTRLALSSYDLQDNTVSCNVGELSHQSLADLNG